MKKTKIKYLEYEDTLEIIFKKNKIPEVVKLSNGIMFEFNKKTLTGIVLPRFLKTIQHPPDPNVQIKFNKMELNEDQNELILILEVYSRVVNLKIDLTELEKYK